MAAYTLRYCARLLVVALTAVLSGCTSSEMIFLRTFSEPPETVDRARVRVISNARVLAVPNTRCYDPSLPGAGTILGGDNGSFINNRLVFSRGFIGRSLDIPGGRFNIAKGMDVAEFYATANQPLTLTVLSTNTNIARCSMAVTFMPEKDQDYETILYVEPAGCHGLLASLSQPEQKITNVSRVSTCQ